MTFRLRPVDAALDAGLVHAWMNDVEVARFWELALPRGDIAAYLEARLASGRSTPYIGCLDGRPMSYWEVYRADLDALSRHYDARAHDTGVHLLIGRPEDRGRGLGGRLLREVAAWALERDAEARRVVAEPDVRNLASIRAFERAGFTRAREVDLPGKRAALMILERGRR